MVNSCNKIYIHGNLFLYKRVVYKYRHVYMLRYTHFGTKNEENRVYLEQKGLAV